MRINLAIVALAALAVGSQAQESALQAISRQTLPNGLRYEFRFSGAVPANVVHKLREQTFYLYLNESQVARGGALAIDAPLRPALSVARGRNASGRIRFSLVLPAPLEPLIAMADSAIVLRLRRPDPPAPDGAEQASKTVGLLPEPVAGRQEKPDPLKGGPKISIDFRNADIGNVLRMLARQNGLNIVTNDSVRGKITVTLQDVTVGQALESILSANGYKHIVENGIILIKSATSFGIHEMNSRVFRLRYVNAHNILPGIQDLLSPEGKTKVLTTSFHFKEDVDEINRKLIPARELKYWLRSSVLLVTDFPANVAAIAGTIEQLDKPVPQVMIEAKLIETSPKENSSVGIDWSKSLSAEIFDQFVLPGGSISRFSSQTPLPDGSVSFGTLNTSQFNAVLNFLKTKMNTRLVSNPRILAMDNEPSDISVGTNFPIPQITRGVGGQGDVVTFDYRDINITLRVTPHVTSDSSITMYVNPIIEEITGQVAVENNSAPITSTREVDTVVKVRHGETIVIGGMINEKEIVTLKKVWLLGDIPLLGNLFRNRAVESHQTDLLIFITPKILPADAD